MTQQEEKKRQARFLSETRRLAREAALEASEAKKKEKEQRKLELLKTGVSLNVAFLNFDSINL